MNATAEISAPTRPFEKLLLQIERQPFAALYRMAIGFLLLLAYQRFPGIKSPTVFLLYFVCVLLAIRVVPLVIRKVLPFSREIQLLWFSRRNLGKEYDSFQWRKLFWIGLGMAAYMVAYGDRTSTLLFIAGVCIIGGAVAHLIWLRLPAARQRF